MQGKLDRMNRDAEKATVKMGPRRDHVIVATAVYPMDEPPVPLPQARHPSTTPASVAFGSPHWPHNHGLFMPCKCMGAAIQAQSMFLAISVRAA